MSKTKTKKAKPAAPKRIAVKHGGKRVEIPLLSGPVGPPHPDLAVNYPTFNAPKDVEIVTYYFCLLADIEFLPDSPAPVSVQTEATQTADVVQCYDTDLNKAIHAFQQKVGITDPEESQYGIIRPDGPTLIALVDYGDLAEQLERAAAAKTNPHNYIYDGHFDTAAFLEKYRDEFSKDGHYLASKEENLRQFLDMLSRDKLIIDVRWMAYILATAFWENEKQESINTGKVNKKKKPIILHPWKAQWSPVNEGGLGKGRRYGLKVKVKKQDDGTALVTEEDGDQFTVGLDGSFKAASKGATADNPKTTALKPAAYAKAEGDELAYYGRGFCQLTWWYNYASVGAGIGMKLDLLFDPEKALEEQVAYDAMSYAMRTGKGFANGHKFSDYFYGATTDYTGARHMVNGVDHAADIAAIAKKFEAILLDPKVRAGGK